MERSARLRGTASPPPFVGRRAELGALIERLRRLAQGSGGVAVIEGEPGIGTSRLVREALQQAGRGVRLLHSGSELLVPELATCTPRSAGSVVATLAGLARDVPVALVLEDLDRADRFHRRLARLVAAHLRDHPVLLVVTARPAPRPPQVDRLFADLVADDAAQLRLPSLQPAETALLATAVAGTYPEAARALLARTGGIPQLVVELVRALVADGVLTRTAQVPPVLPAPLRPVVLGRLDRLPRSTVDLLRMAAVLGPTFEVTHLARFAGETAVRLLPVLEDALRAGVLERAGPQLAVRPELLRDALYDDIAPAIRAALHVDAARVLTEAGAPAAMRAEHLVNAGATSDPAVLRGLESAAQHALSGSPPAAVELLQRGLEGAGPQRRDTLLADLAVAQLWSGRLGEAEQIARDLLERPHDPAAGDAVRLALVEALRHQGQYQEAVTEAATLLDDSELPARVRARLRAERAHALLLAGERDSAGAAAATAAREARDARAASVARAALAGVALGSGRTALAVELATHAVDRATRNRVTVAGDAQALVLARHTLATALLLADRTDEAERAVNAGLHAAEALGNALAVPSYQLLRAVLRFRTGRWDEAVTDAETGLAAARAAGLALGVAPAVGALAMIAVHRNELAEAEGMLAGAPTGSAVGAHWVQWARSLHEEACGRSDPAVATLRRAWSTCTRTGFVADYLLLGADLVRLLLAVGDSTSAQATAAQVEEVSSRTGTAAARGIALRCHGLLHGDPQLLRRAARVLAGQPYPLVAAQVSEEAAAAGTVAAGTVDDPAETAALLEAARGGYRSLGAHRDLARVQARLRSVGVRTGRHRPRRRGEGWDSLTTAERMVVAWIDQGLTNREIAERLFISPRTVETHLTHVFAKLDLQGRPALRLALARRTGDATAGPASVPVPGAAAATSTGVCRMFGAGGASSIGSAIDTDRSGEGGRRDTDEDRTPGDRRFGRLHRGGRGRAHRGDGDRLGGRPVPDANPPVHDLPGRA